jgi:hypothetical protein
MMKKLIVLLLVLGIASLANATLSATPFTYGNVTWSVVNDQLVGHGDSKGTYDGGLVPSATITPDPTLTPAGLPTYDTGKKQGGDLASISGIASIPGGYYTYAADSGVGDQIVGDWFVFDLSGEQTVDVYDTSSGANKVGTITIVPEPATLALLGLGGLLLRRRK